MYRHPGWCNSFNLVHYYKFGSEFQFDWRTIKTTPAETTTIQAEASLSLETSNHPPKSKGLRGFKTQSPRAQGLRFYLGICAHWTRQASYNFALQWSTMYCLVLANNLATKSPTPITCFRFLHSWFFRRWAFWKRAIIIGKMEIIQDPNWVVLSYVEFCFDPSKERPSFRVCEVIRSGSRGVYSNWPATHRCWATCERTNFVYNEGVLLLSLHALSSDGFAMLPEYGGGRRLITKLKHFRVLAWVRVRGSNKNRNCDSHLSSSIKSKSKIFVLFHFYCLSLIIIIVIKYHMFNI